MAEKPSHFITGDLLNDPKLVYFREGVQRPQQLDIPHSMEMDRLRREYLEALQKEAEDTLRWTGRYGE